MSVAQSTISTPTALTHPVRGASGEDVPDDGPAVATARDAEAEPVPVVRQHDHLNLGPFAEELREGNRREIEGKKEKVRELAL